MQVDTNTRGH